MLKDDGRLLIVAPNRSGMWAYWDSTPFGHGLPYSAGQLGRLLAAGLFRVERRDAALWMPPSQLRILLRSAPLFERAGRDRARAGRRHADRGGEGCLRGHADQRRAPTPPGPGGSRLKTRAA